MHDKDRNRLDIDIEKRLGRFSLNVRFEVATEILVLYGPSGAGKSTTLNAIAGLNHPDAGEISLDRELFFRRHRDGPSCNLPARSRRIGYVFQHYSLFPHMTALENVAYPRTGRKNRHQRARELLDRMGLAHLAGHRPHELSGGQRQRVAIARALAIEPRILLLDEPFSALDLALRQRFQQELGQLQQELCLVVIYVTHNLDDAFAMGNRLAVLQEGRIRQIGPVDEVFRYPADHQVAEVMGIRNLFRARVVAATGAGLVLDWDGLGLHAPIQPLPGKVDVTVYIQPEDIKIIYPDRPLMDAVSHNQVEGNITSRSLNANFESLQVRLKNGHEVEVRFPRHAYIPLSLNPGEKVLLSLRRECLTLLPPAGKRKDG